MKAFNRCCRIAIWLTRRVGRLISCSKEVWSANRKDGQIVCDRLYMLMRVDSNPFSQRGFMAFRPNFRRDRAERDRLARARSAEKLQKREEKSAQRKALRAAAEVPARGAEQVPDQLAENNGKDRIP